MTFAWKKYRIPLAAAATFAVAFHLLPAIRASIVHDTTDSQATIVSPEPGVTVDVTVTLSPAKGPGAVAGYQVHVENRTDEVKGDMEVSVPLPAGMGYEALRNQTTCTQEERTLLCDGSVLPPYGATDLYIVLTPLGKEIPCGTELRASAFVRFGNKGWSMASPDEVAVEC